MNNEILLENLKPINNYDAALAQKIYKHEVVLGNIELYQTNIGDYNIKYNKANVHDEEDPIFEAQNLFKQTYVENKDVFYIILGLGLGYIFKQFSEKINSNNIIVFEPNLDILKFTLSAVDLSKDLMKKNIFLSNSPDEFFDRFKSTSFNYSNKVKVCSLPFYNYTYPQFAQDLAKQEERYNREVSIITEPIKINVGAGNWQKEGWKTVDCYQDADIQVDLRKFTPFPIADGAIEKVFSSHCIEHIEDNHFEYMLKELFRCMKSGAIIRLACPDADKALEAYKNKDIKWFDGMITVGNLGERLVNTFVSYEKGGPKVDEKLVEEKFNTLPKDEFIKWCLSLCDRNRPYIAHINGHYFEKMEKQLKDAGFVNIKRSEYRQSADIELRGDYFDLHKEVSLFVEAYKP